IPRPCCAPEYPRTHSLQRLHRPRSRHYSTTQSQNYFFFFFFKQKTAYEIKAHGQRIVYLLHDSIGHLGIFVSAKIAGREHEAITDTMRAIEALPPGLYEMVLENSSDRMHIKFAPRTIEDILKLDDGRKDEEMFAAVAKISELKANAYETLVRPFLRLAVNENSAKLFFNSRPLRVERVAFSDRNPLMSQVKTQAEQARAARKPVDADNPFLAFEKL